MDHEELVRKYSSDPSTWSPEEQEKHRRFQEQRRKLHETGQWSQPKEGDNFPIGLDDNFEPFPVRERGDLSGSAESSEQDDTHDGN